MGGTASPASPTAAAATASSCPSCTCRSGTFSLSVWNITDLIFLQFAQLSVQESEPEPEPEEAAPAPVQGDHGLTALAQYDYEVRYDKPWHNFSL